MDNFLHQIPLSFARLLGLRVSRQGPDFWLGEDWQSERSCSAGGWGQMFQFFLCCRNKSIYRCHALPNFLFAVRFSGFCPEMLEAAHKIGDQSCSCCGCGTFHYFLIPLGLFILATVWCEWPGQPNPGTRPAGSGIQKGSAPACRLTANRSLSTCSCGTYEHMNMWVMNSHEPVQKRDSFDFGNAEAM